LLSELECDIAFYRGDVWGHRQQETLSGTLYFQYNERSIDLLNKWIEYCASDKVTFDQSLFQTALDAVKVNTTILPVEYCAIFDAPGNNKRDVVIRHLQASRTMRQP
jgi:hypothetical protein